MNPLSTPSFKRDIFNVVAVGTILLLIVFPFAQTPTPTPAPYTGPYPVVKDSNAPIPGEVESLRMTLFRTQNWFSTSDSGNRINVLEQFGITPPSRFSYSFPTVAPESNVTYSDDFSNPVNSNWVTYYGEQTRFTKLDRVRSTTRWPNPQAVRLDAPDFVKRDAAWNGNASPQIDSRLGIALKERTFNRNGDFLSLDPWHFSQNQPYDIYTGNYPWIELYTSSNLNSILQPPLLTRDVKEYNWWNNFQNTALTEYIYLLDREVPANFEMSFTFIRNGSFGGFGVVLGKDPIHLPGQVEYKSRWSGSLDYFPLALEDQPAAIAYFQNPGASQSFPTSDRTLSRWKDRGFLRPLFVAKDLSYDNKNLGWNPMVNVKDRMVANGTHDTANDGSAEKGFGQNWGGVYALKAGVPYRVTLARVNSVIYLRVVNIGPNADPTDWIAYQSDSRDADSITKSSGVSPTLAASASTLDPEVGQRIYFFAKHYGSNRADHQNYSSLNVEFGEFETARDDETSFGGAIDDLVIRTLNGPADLSPLPTATLPTVTATPIATTKGYTDNYRRYNIVYVTYRLDNLGTSEAENVQLYGDLRFSFSTREQAYPARAFDQNGDLSIQDKKDGVPNVRDKNVDTRPWSINGQNSRDISLLLTVVNSIPAGTSREVTVAYYTSMGSWQLRDNDRVYVTVGPQNTRVSVASNVWGDPTDTIVTNDVHPHLDPSPYRTPEDILRTKPEEGYDGVTGPYGFYDWSYQEGYYSKIPLAFPARPADTDQGTWEPYLQYRYDNNIGKFFYDGAWRFLPNGTVVTSPGTNPGYLGANTPAILKKVKLRRGKLKLRIIDPDGIALVKVKIGKRFRKAKTRNGKVFFVNTRGEEPKKVRILVTDQKGVTERMREKVR